jgi:hypothetical protein
MGEEESELLKFTKEGKPPILCVRLSLLTSAIKLASNLPTGVAAYRLLIPPMEISSVVTSGGIADETETPRELSSSNAAHVLFNNAFRHN